MEVELLELPMESQPLRCVQCQPLHCVQVTFGSKGTTLMSDVLRIFVLRIYLISLRLKDLAGHSL